MYKESIEDFSRGMQIENETAKLSSLFQRANAYYSLKQYKEALKDLDLCVNKKY